jgi:5-methyltetrahydropteroyltriglutamate--homocysteine methyltransferase
MPKITIPSPTIIHFRAGRENISKGAYPDIDLFWDDIVDAFHQELKALAAAGCRYVQIDETTLASLSDPRIREPLRKRGDDARTLLLDTYPTVINRALAGRPATLHLAMHICRGNNQSHWSAEGGYDLMADTLFNKIDVDSYFLEYDTPRAGSFEPLRLVPKNKTVVLGLVSSKFPELESKDSLKRRIDEAAKFIALDQLSISPQCGFASTAPGNKISAAVQRAKLELVVEVAREVWG